MTDDINLNAIAANIEALNWIVRDASAKTTEAHDYMRRGDRLTRGGLVLDPFAGSGSTAVAAALTGRQYA